MILGPQTLFSQAPGAKEKSVKTEIRTFNVNPGTKLIIENETGDITVEGWDKNTCELNLFKASTVAANFDNIKIDADERPNRLKLKTTFTQKLSGDVSVDYMLSVPPGVHLQLKTSAGKISVREVTGPLSLYTEKGDIQLKNVTGLVDAKTDLGTITMDLPSGITQDVTLKAEEGHIKLNAPKELNAFIWAETEGGTVKNDLTLQTVYNAEPNLVKGQIGNGGKLVRLQVVRGNIALAQLAGGNVASTVAKAEPSKLPDREPDADGKGAGGRGAKSEERLAKTTDREPSANGDDTGTGLVPASKHVEPPPNFRPSVSPSSATQGAKSPAARSGVTYTVDTNLISVNATVKNRATAKSLTSLRKEDFLVYEDNVLQTISHFSPVETPFHLLLLLDISGSIEEKFNIVQEASIQFTRMLKPQDRIAIAVFNHDFSLVNDFTNDRHELARTILSIVPGGGTAFYDAMGYSINNVFKGITGRKAIVVFTDGVDNQHMPDQQQNGSTLTFDELFRTIEETDTTIYSIFLNTEGDPRSGVIKDSAWDNYDAIINDILGIKPKKRPANKRKSGGSGQVVSDLYANALDELNKIADQTGGKLYSPTDAKDLNGIYEQIVEDLSVQYSLGYYPTNPAEDSQWRRITVKVKDKSDVVVRTRRGYYANFSARQRKDPTRDVRTGKRRVF
jgi:VWFA-related protein